jgi:hypothetical protein
MDTYRFGTTHHLAEQLASRALEAILAMPTQKLQESRRARPQPTARRIEETSWWGVVGGWRGRPETILRTAPELFNPPRTAQVDPKNPVQRRRISSVVFGRQWLGHGRGTALARVAPFYWADQKLGPREMAWRKTRRWEHQTKPGDLRYLQSVDRMFCTSGKQTKRVWLLKKQVVNEGP